MADRLYKSRTDRVISGVAGGLAEQLNLDPSLVRVAWVVLAIVSGGIVALIYLVMMIVVPEQPDEWPANQFTGAPPPPRPGDAIDPRSTPPIAGSPVPEPPGTPDVGASPPVGTWLGPDGRRVDRATAAVPRPPGATGPRGRPARSGDRGGALVVGVILILLGSFFLLRQFVPQVDLGAVWPLLAVAAGVVLIVLALKPGSTSR
jgi:phage shock protein PspC (stress-responsive transcriptional regulator)